MAKQREEALFERGTLRPLDVQLHQVVAAGQWEIVDVAFTASNVDTQVAYTHLEPPTPESVEYTVLRQTGLGTVYEDRSAGRAKWGDGYIILRSTAPQTARLLLQVLKTPKDWSLTDTAASATLTVPAIDTDALTVDALAGYLKATAGVVSATAAPLPAADLGSGTPTSGKYLRGDGSWQAIAESEITDGSLLARVGSTETISAAWSFSTVPSLGTLTGYIKGASGTLSASATVPEADIADGTVLARLAANETISGNWHYDGTTTLDSTVIFNNVYSQTGLSGSYNNVGSGQSRDAVGLYVVSSSGGAVTWTGLTGGVDKKIALILNFEGAQTLTLSHDSGSSDAANRFYCPNGTNYVIPTYGSALLCYYGTRWMVVGPVA